MEELTLVAFHDNHSANFGYMSEECWEVLNVLLQDMPFDEQDKIGKDCEDKRGCS